MDEIARYNIERWQALVEAQALFSRPQLDLDPSQAQALLDPERRLGDVAGKAVLCLASGGGQQSVAFALLGAHVTVVDLSEAQLQRDRQAAARYGLDITVLQADMRDLSALEAASFDIVYQPYSLGFVPDAQVVFEQVARLLRLRGQYYFMCANPFVLGVAPQDWNGEGYTLKHPYIDGAEVRYDDQDWVYDRSASKAAIPAPREFRHTLGALVSGLVRCGFVIMHLSDEAGFTPDPNAEAGTWAHVLSVAPPWLSFWAMYRPDVLAEAG
ncbi:MAG TPA: class I SAM-dependent methyltransferase [Roseiflexaceae bacterium]|nr:class I SAM-dependent methyltransferase [Roseiflexaceae bacterium]